jgi:hypothetical protein
MAKKTKPPIDPEWDPVIRSNYANACLSDGDWLYLADDLLECATILENRVEETFKRLRARSRGVAGKLISQGPSAVHLMLMAYAVENLFKAAPNRSKYARDFEVERLPDELKSHNLVDLAKKAGVKIDLEVEDLLRRLEQCAVWRGRYCSAEHIRTSAEALDSPMVSNTE